MVFTIDEVIVEALIEEFFLRTNSYVLNVATTMLCDLIVCSVANALSFRQTVNQISMIIQASNMPDWWSELEHCNEYYLSHSWNESRYHW